VRRTLAQPLGSLAAAVCRLGRACDVVRIAPERQSQKLATETSGAPAS
jgi:hypothetical protein